MVHEFTSRSLNSGRVCQLLLSRSLIRSLKREHNLASGKGRNFTRFAKYILIRLCQRAQDRGKVCIFSDFGLDSENHIETNRHRFLATVQRMSPEYRP